MNAPRLYAHIRTVFEKNGIESPQFEAMCVAEHIFGKKLDRILLDKPEATEEQINFANGLAYRRINGEPLQYLLGEWEFYGMPFYVGRGVLIPRQDTETLVESAIRCSEAYSNPDILDLCSGSGCIACAIWANVKNAKVYALENSERAIGYLNKNIRRSKADVTVIEGDALNENTKTVNFDIIVCNPPYLTEDDMKNLQKEVSFEPKEALFGGKDGLKYYRELTRIWSKRLKNSGVLIYEIGVGQEKDVYEIMSENGLTNIEFIKDLPGIIRVVKGEKRMES